MKTVWRWECIEPCNTFYIQAMNTVSSCIVALRPLISFTTRDYDVAALASADVAALRQQFAPKINTSRKRINDTEDKVQRMHRLVRNLRLSLADAQKLPAVQDESLFDNMLGAALDASIGPDNNFKVQSHIR